MYIGWSPCVQTSRLSASRRFSPSLNPNPNPNQVRTGVDTQAAGLSAKCRLSKEKKSRRLCSLDAGRGFFPRRRRPTRG